MKHSMHKRRRNNGSKPTRSTDPLTRLVITVLDESDYTDVRMAKATGIATVTIRRWRSGKTYMNGYFAKRILEVLGFRYEVFLTKIDE